jgi:hypothetical protein
MTYNTATDGQCETWDADDAIVYGRQNAPSPVECSWQISQEPERLTVRVITAHSESQLYSLHGPST